MEKKNYINKNWGKIPLIDIANNLNIDLKETLELAISLNLKHKETSNLRRTWTKDEDDFLKKHRQVLSVREASNLLYRSHHATYQRIRLLGLNEMIK